MRTSYREPEDIEQDVDSVIAERQRASKKEVKRSTIYTEALRLYRKYRTQEDANKVFAAEFERLHKLIERQHEEIKQLRFENNKNNNTGERNHDVH